MKKSKESKKNPKKTPIKTAITVKMSIRITAEKDKGMAENMTAFRKVAQRKSRWVTYDIEDYKIKIDHIGTRDSNYKLFVSKLPKTQPRYAVYDHEYKTSDGRLTSKMYFIFWTPKNVNQTDKVIYSQALNDFRAKFNGVINKDAYSFDDIEDMLNTEFANGKFTIPQIDSDEEAESDSDFD